MPHLLIAILALIASGVAAQAGSVRERPIERHGLLLVRSDCWTGAPRRDWRDRAWDRREPASRYDDPYPPYDEACAPPLYDAPPWRHRRGPWPHERVGGPEERVHPRWEREKSPTCGAGCWYRRLKDGYCGHGCDYYLYRRR
ncbi:MAG: hypothetical protein NW215_13410 [Hyphomicrobiales bacterium]|nr:hypothetical protein [Hyphomicrobiales bacterium]